jgi:hypothetical protein
VDIREAGENLVAAFPAVEIIDGADGASDRLIVRRNLFSEVLSLCQQVDAGSATTQLVYATAGSVAGCVLSGQDHNHNVWKNYRLANGGSVKAFLYDSAARVGEFFDYGNEVRTYTSYSIIRTNAGTWSHTYPAASSAIYLLEEWDYSMSGDLLRLIQNRDTGNALNVAFGITDFQVTARMQDGTERASFAPTDPWTSIQTLRLDLSGSEKHAGGAINRTERVSFAPRNILSN